ncbi:MAG: hypothetical protein GEU73_13150 [Chloroflexi bacterium]|nr:hypothetical protein [Chloroflexota bacterium]
MNLPNSPLLNHEVVGLGPYEITSWDIGSHVEATRFDDYFRGRSPDRSG